MAVGLEIELDDLHVLFDRFSTVRLRTALVEAYLHFSKELVIGGFAALWGIQAQIGT
jgi:hypothetical protein